MKRETIASGAAKVIAKQAAEIERLKAERDEAIERAKQAEDVIDAINTLRDRAYEEIKQERDEAREAASYLLRDWDGPCESQLTQAERDTLEKVCSWREHKGGE